jgi:hypothetical protein
MASIDAATSNFLIIVVPPKNALLTIASSMAARPRTASALAESTRLPQRFDVCVTAGKKLLE